MGWQALRSRELDVDWAALGDRCIDPYLLWADATRFLGFCNPAGRSARTVQVALEFDTARQSALDRRLRRWVRRLSDRPSLPMGPRFRVLQLPVSTLRLLLCKPVLEVVKRFELGMALATGQGAQALRNRGARALGATRIDGAQAVQAVIDDGCPFLHSSFRTLDGSGQWRTRIRYLWFQEERQRFGLQAGEIDALLNAGAARNEREGYRWLRDKLDNDWRAAPAGAAHYQQMLGAATHGAHVLDVAAGAPNPLAGRLRLGQADDAASRAPIVFVQLPRATVADTSGSSMNACVLEALAYIDARVAATTPVVVNLSYGALAGPHDGSSLLEQAMDDFLDRHPNFKAIVLPAGNGYESNTHASITVGADSRWHSLHFKVQPNDPTDTFIEVWYDGAAVLELDLSLPGEPAGSGPAPRGTACEWCNGADMAVAALIHAGAPPSGPGGKRAALIAIAPTLRTGAGRAVAPHGSWMLRLRNRGALPVAVDAWIERDDAPFHSGRSRSQAVWLTAARPSSATAPPIQRLGTLNSLAHGTRTTVVGGSVRATGEMAAYSAAGPGRQKPVPGPDLVAPCEENIGLGLLAAGTRSGSQVRMAGTSVAAPLVARAIVNAGSVQALDTDPHRPALGERRHPPGAPVPDPRWHRGAFGLVEP